MLSKTAPLVSPDHQKDKMFRAEKHVLANYLKAVGYEAQFV